MVTREDVESFLLRMELEVEELDKGMWLVHAPDEGTRMVVHYSPPLVVLRTKVLDVPGDQQRCTELYRRLLELNAHLRFGAFARADGAAPSPAAAVTAVTGGSAALPALRQAFAAAFPHATPVFGDPFSSVAKGLGMRASQLFR